MNHPLNETLRNAGNAGNKSTTPTKDKKSPATAPSAKLRSIPVRLLFNDPELNLRASYCLFDRSNGRPLCVGNGETCRRSTTKGMVTLTCPSPEACELAFGGACKPYGRMNVRIGDDEDLGSFVFRTTGFNSIRTLATRLSYFHALSGGLLSALPLELRLRGKSTTQSHGTPIYYVDLALRTGMAMKDAIQSAREETAARQAAGFDQTALDDAARIGFAQGAFEESAEEGAAVVEEFYPVEGQGTGQTAGHAADRGSASPSGDKTPLAQKLAHKASALTASSG